MMCKDYFLSRFHEGVAEATRHRGQVKLRNNLPCNKTFFKCFLREKCSILLNSIQFNFLSVQGPAPCQMWV